MLDLKPEQWGFSKFSQRAMCFVFTLRAVGVCLVQIRTMKNETKITKEIKM